MAVIYTCSFALCSVESMLQLFVHVDVQLKCYGTIDTFSSKMYRLSCFRSIDDNDYFYLL